MLLFIAKIYPYLEYSQYTYVFKLQLTIMKSHYQALNFLIVSKMFLKYQKKRFS